MSKEKRYQDDAQKFIEKQFEAYNGKAMPIYTEEFSTQFDNVLQECSPLIGGVIGDANYQSLKDKFSIIGLREKIIEFNQESVKATLAKHKRPESVNEVLGMMFQNFKSRYMKSENIAEIYKLIFSPNQDLKSSEKREITLLGLKEPLEYNVIYWENPVNYMGKNAFYIVRERRVPVVHEYKESERSDFLLYINGIPLVLVEYKTEDSGISSSLKDFEQKESYSKVPFKIALNDGRDVIFFSEISFLKHSLGQANGFYWVNYLPEKKYIGTREFTNIEYLFDELFCQPENLYGYCVDACTVTDTSSKAYLTNARIQQYYALKDIRKTLVNTARGHLQLPYAFEVAHAQRSGKTITMKFIIYMIERSFKSIFNTVLIYTPDLQIKDVINAELSKSGNPKVSIKMIMTRREYQDLIEELCRLEEEGKEPTSLTVYIINMQKITDAELQDAHFDKVIYSSKILNIIDEAHHGQTQKTAEIRDSIFPYASNYLFTATGKIGMYAYYFPENQKIGFSSRFTISNARECKITVPVMFLSVEKHIKETAKFQQFIHILDNTLEENNRKELEILGHANDDYSTPGLNAQKRKAAQVVKKSLGSPWEKICRIVSFMDSVRGGLPFNPKAIVYVNSIQEAKYYIKLIQGRNSNNWFGLPDGQQYRFGVDFSAIDAVCEEYNPGMTEPGQIGANFQKERPLDSQDNLIIDILFAVDKYQKGFDLPPLLVTFLDTNINEPARINQIFTRSATKFPGKTTGYCVDLTLDKINQRSFKESLALYDRADDHEGFVDEDMLENLNKVLSEHFNWLIKELGLTRDNFTPNMILQQILNEPDMKLRQHRQCRFFEISRNIMNSMRKIGSPLFFRPYALELRILHEAFREFKVIYADKEHPDHPKILINLDEGLRDNLFITDEEIRRIISDVLEVMNEHHIGDIISMHYTGEQEEILPQEGDRTLTLQRFAQELNKRNLDERLEGINSSVWAKHIDLCIIINDMLLGITQDRNIIYERATQEKIEFINQKLDDIYLQINQDIENKFSGNKCLYWLQITGEEKFAQYGITEFDFVKYVSEEVNKSLKIIFPQIEPDLMIAHKVKIAKTMFLQKTSADNFSYFISEFREKFILSDIFKEQVKNSSKIHDKPIMVNREFFAEYLEGALKEYFQE